MRYAAIPPQASLDARQMSGGRHKKEIKRRTKTGCMTCRKRRIKCDEGQPTCRNCAKSKRECLGYEALFKQQSAGPAAIAAKPDPTPVQAPATPTSLSTNLYINPHSYPTTGGAFVEYGASLDPALGMGDHSLDMTQNHHSSLLAERRVKHVDMDDLFSINDIPPKYEKREAPPPLWQRAAQEVQDLYTFHFAPGLNKVFETDWFTLQGPSTMSTMPELHDFVAQCTEQLKVQADSPAATNQLRSLEARLVWLLADMARQSLPDSELSARVDTLEHLLTSQPLTPSAIPSPPNPNMEQRTYSEHSFWHNLGRFVSAHDGLTDPAGQRETTEALAGMRGILGLLENRDVLYSIAVARHLGGRLAETNHSQHLLASTNDQNDEIHKLRVARQFVETEDQAGTTQVIQRICSMAIRGWALQKQ
ncbi:White-opaque regulator 1 [Teratosphaeria destructans]|uniref:White-opaque regulator 1 n=1 Tax=Teratosphaeria destructans TaxID=418781 RepID=A0A9W7VZU8_9PEZI|nr:White-opaque regulator 1 [Teratosphaeria destructans]